MDQDLLIKSPTKRQTARMLRAAVRNPMDIWPPEIYHRPMVALRLFGSTRYFVAEPSLIQQALVDQAGVLHKSEPMRRALESALGSGILTAEDERWRTQRRAAAPVFRPGHVNSFLPAMLAAAEKTKARWQSLPPGTTLEMCHEMMALTFEIIAQTMLSGHGNIDAARVERAMADFLGSTSWNVVYSVLGLPEWAPYPGRGRALAGSRYLRELVAGLAAERRASNAAPDDLLSLMLQSADPETGLGLNETEVIDNLLTFIAAGHETTALALTWTFHLLTHHPEVEARILAEVAEVTGGAPLDASQVSQLGYTRQVISEAMRIYPPVAAIGREVTAPMRLGEQEVAAGDRVIVPIYAVHHHSALWEAPEMFDPERFSPEAVKSRHRYAWLPFGAGPRICIGAQFAMLEAVALLAVLLPAVRLEATPGYVPVPISRITMRPRDGMPIRVGKR